MPGCQTKEHLQVRLARRIDAFLCAAAFRWALFVYDHRGLFLLVPGLLGVGFGSGLILAGMREIRRPEELFTPSDSRAKVEFDEFKRLWPLDQDAFLPGKSIGNKIQFELLVRAKDGGSVLDPDVLAQVEDLNTFLLDHFISNENVTYAQICLRYDGECYKNQHLEIFRRREKVLKYTSRLYPSAGSEEAPAYTGNLIGGLRMDGDRILGAQTLRLFYYMRQDIPTVTVGLDARSRRFNVALQDFLERRFEAPKLSIDLAHSESMLQGMDQTNERFMPNFVISLGLLAVFSILCNTTLRASGDKGSRIDWVRSRPWHAVGALLSSSLGLAAATGALLLFGMPYNGIVNISIFLILSIGIDDMFIIVAGWEASAEGDPRLRLADALRHSVVSITITSLTDAVSFAVGAYSSLLGVQIFCVYAAAAVVADYVFQLSFFLGLMAFLGEAESRRRHCLLPCLPRAAKVRAAAAPKTQASSSGSVSTLSSGETTAISRTASSAASTAAIVPASSPQGTHVATFVRRFYGPFLAHTATKVAAVALGIAYVVMAVLGTLHLEEGLNPANIVMSDHHLVSYFHSLEETFFRQGMLLQIGVTRPPDLATSAGRDQILQLAFEMENTPYSLGYNATVLWLRSFYAFLDGLQAPVEDETWSSQVADWMSYGTARAQWEADVVWAPDRRSFSAFKFQIGLRNIESPLEQRKALGLLRSITDGPRYSSLGVICHNQLLEFVEQYELILPNTLRNVGIGLAAMGVVAVVFVPSPVAAAAIVASVVSIDAGVFGWMGWWGVRLDAVSMICVIMSMGFAVDLSAHLTVAFLAAPSADAQDRALDALTAVGWPVLQGGASTLLGISILGTVEAYIVQTFFKTVFLVVGFGLLHSLFFLPIILPLLPIPRPDNIS